MTRVRDYHASTRARPKAYLEIDAKDGFLAALAVYYDDIVMLEPGLLKMYDEILPRLDRALGVAR